MVAAGTIFWWGGDVLAATEVETTTPRVERSAVRAARIPPDGGEAGRYGDHGRGAGG
jgi:hypothetical protein